jgi:isopentenyl-diphosphate delta-isomerase
MPDNPTIHSRKSDHIRINLEEDVQSGLTTGFDRYTFIHRALPEIDLDDVNLSQVLFKRTLNAPILISSMTGGTREAEAINRVLAMAAQETRIAMGVGSQRAALEHPELSSTFQMRHYAPDILLFANIGAIQLNYGYGIDQCKKAVDMIEADALILHLNALQEAVQPEGETQFAGLLNKIENICQEIQVPVIAKEVGWGFSEWDARRLYEVGVSAIDVAGAGGTSWSQVEMHRATNVSQKRLAAAFINWGIPTTQSIINVKNAAPGLLIFASGGIRSGVDIAKSIALGASLGGLAGPFLKAAARSLEETLLMISELRHEIQICMFAAGAGSLESLQKTPMVYSKQR